MAFLGDLWVRLGLKSDDYKKGLNSARNETEGFIGKMKNLKAGTLALWAAVGTGVMKFAKDFINATNKMGDAWAHTMSSIKAQYQVLLGALSNTSLDTSGSGGKVGNAIKNEISWWKRLFGNMKEAGSTAREASEAFDAEFELVNSVKIQRERATQELNKLMLTMRDTTLGASAREAAKERYKAILEPLAQAEIEVYTRMLDKAIEAWQGGMNLSRQYSTQEVSDFFAMYGTNPADATAKYPELQGVYEKHKGDKQNQVIFDIIVRSEQARNEMSNLEAELGRIGLSIKKDLATMFNIGSDTPSQYMRKELSEIKKMMSEDWASEMRDVADSFTDMSVDDIAADMGIDMTSVDDEMRAFLDSWKSDVEQVAQLNQMLSDSFVSAFGNGMQAITDLMMGIEGADMKSVMAAFIAPFADTMKQMGSMIMSEGIAMVAFKKSFSNPYAAIAAGAALIAVGSAVSSGLQRLTANPTGGSAGSTASSGSYGSSELNKYESTLTVEVTGKISGNDIVLSGKKTNDYNRR